MWYFRPAFIALGFPGDVSRLVKFCIFTWIASHLFIHCVKCFTDDLIPFVWLKKNVISKWSNVTLVLPILWVSLDMKNITRIRVIKLVNFYQIKTLGINKTFITFICKKTFFNYFLFTLFFPNSFFYVKPIAMNSSRPQKCMSILTCGETVKFVDFVCNHI